MWAPLEVTGCHGSHCGSFNFHLEALPGLSWFRGTTFPSPGTGTSCPPQEGRADKDSQQGQSLGQPCMTCPVPALHSPTLSLPLAPSALTTQASLRLLQHSRHSPASGPLHGYSICLLMLLHPSGLSTTTLTCRARCPCAVCNLHDPTQPLWWGIPSIACSRHSVNALSDDRFCLSAPCTSF